MASFHRLHTCEFLFIFHCKNGLSWIISEINRDTSPKLIFFINTHKHSMPKLRGSHRNFTTFCMAKLESQGYYKVKQEALLSQTSCTTVSACS